MRPVDQTILDSNRGNCFTACIASILELPLNAVPHFVLFGDEWWDAFLAWLAELGLSASIYPTSDDAYVPPGWTIAGGPSKRFAGRMHACVALDGIVVHDPHPSRDGLPEGIAHYIVIHGPNREYEWFNGIGDP